MKSESDAVEEKERETTGTPLCCTRWRQISKDLQAEWMFYFLIYILFDGRSGYNQIELVLSAEKAVVRRMYRKVTAKKNKNKNTLQKSSWLLTACSHFVDCCGCEFCITPYLGANGFRSCELCCPLWPGIYSSSSSWTFYFLRISQPFGVENSYLALAEATVDAEACCINACWVRQPGTSLPWTGQAGIKKMHGWIFFFFFNCSLKMISLPQVDGQRWVELVLHSKEIYWYNSKRHQRLTDLPLSFELPPTDPFVWILFVLVQLPTAASPLFCSRLGSDWNHHRRVKLHIVVLLSQNWGFPKEYFLLLWGWARSAWRPYVSKWCVGETTELIAMNRGRDNQQYCSHERRVFSLRAGWIVALQPSVGVTVRYRMFDCLMS